jgi:hypothetical protein
LVARAGLFVTTAFVAEQPEKPESEQRAGGMGLVAVTLFGLPAQAIEARRKATILNIWFSFSPALPRFIYTIWMADPAQSGPMKETFNPDLFVAKWYCSFLYPEEMPQFAADALEAGHDGPALRRLAGMVKATSTDIGDLFKQSLIEIGTVTIHNAEQAAILLARMTARDIIEGRIDTLKGAIFLAGLASRMNYPAYLVPFYQLAELPYWGEYAPRRAQLIEDIINEARLLPASVAG